MSISSDSDMGTFHASPERTNTANLARQIGYFRDNPLLRQAFDASNAMQMVVNDCRQVVYVNSAFRRQLGLNDETQLFGKRPGEIIGCPHAADNQHGCGTGRACRNCGAVNLVLQAMANNQEFSGEVILSSRTSAGDAPFEFLMQVVPVRSEQDAFYVISFIDASDLVRRRALERIFFHDIINTAGALKGILGLLRAEAPAELQTDLAFVEQSFGGLLAEIQAQKQLLEAENNELAVERAAFFAHDAVTAVSKLYERHAVALNRTVLIDSASDNRQCVSDLRLLKRVLGNMLKNALEATPEGGCVRLGNQALGDDGVKFWVHNDGYISEAVQYRMFQRSHSTKGPGRGLGTYSMKLLGERYLDGLVDFVSTKAAGTTFFIVLPCSPTEIQ